MEIIALLFHQNLIMAGYLCIGVLLFRKKIITLSGSGELGKLLLYLIMPVAIVKSYLRPFSAELAKGLVISAIAGALALLLAILISALVFRNKHKVHQFGTSFSNAGFIGIPLVDMVVGGDGVFYMASFVAFLNILQWTYGVYHLTGSKEVIKPKTLVKNPIVLSFLVGIVLFILQLPIPSEASSMLSTIAGMNGPVAMMVLGVYLAQLPMKELWTGKETYYAVVTRLVFIPLLTLGLLSFIPQSYLELKLAILIAASAPVGSNVAIFANLYQKDYTSAVKIICVSTICCIFTLPFILGIANYIW